MSFLRQAAKALAALLLHAVVQAALLRRIRPEPVTRNRFAAARFVFIFGMGCLGLFRWATLPAAAPIVRGAVREVRGVHEKEPFLPAGKRCFRGPRL
jgi:hypothetical protein